MCLPQDCFISYLLYILYFLLNIVKIKKTLKEQKSNTIVLHNCATQLYYHPAGLSPLVHVSF